MMCGIRERKCIVFHFVIVGSWVGNCVFSIFQFYVRLLFSLSLHNPQIIKQSNTYSSSSTIFCVQVFVIGSINCFFWVFYKSRRTYRLCRERKENSFLVFSKCRHFFQYSHLQTLDFREFNCVILFVFLWVLFQFRLFGIWGSV